MNPSNSFPLLMSLLFLWSNESVHGASYKVIDLGPGAANDINNLGHVVGSRSDAEPSDALSSARPFFYDGHSTRLVTSTNQVVYAVNPETGQPLVWNEVLYTADGINDSDHISGITLYKPYARGRWAYVKAGDTVSHPDTDERSVTRAVLNNSDVVAEIWEVFDGINSRYKWEYGINESGLKVGALSEVRGFRQPQFLPRAALIQGNDVTYIDEQPPVSQEYFGSSVHLSAAFAANTAGHVVGFKLVGAQTLGGALFGGAQKAFLYKGGPLQLLGTLGGTNSVAYDINSRDQIVGTAQVSNGQMHAFIWDDGQMVDLNARLVGASDWAITSAAGINETGSIVGTGILGGVQHAVLLVPVEPGPTLTAKNYVGITIAGKQGIAYRIEYQPTGSAESWVALKTVTLEKPEQVIFDEESTSHPGRIYRAVEVP